MRAISVAMFLMIMVVGYAQNLYVDPINGDDSKNGQTYANRIKSLSRLNALITNNVKTVYLFDTVHYGSLQLKNITRTFQDPLIVTTYNEYTSKGKATISGFAKLGAFTSLGNNLWRISDNRLPGSYKYVVSAGSDKQEYLKFMGAGLFINGVKQRISKYPHGEAASFRFSNKDVSSAKAWVEDNANKFSANHWNGAELVVQRDDWSTDIVRVNTYTSAGRFNIVPAEWQSSKIGSQSVNGNGNPTELPSYYIVNHLNAISASTPYHYSYTNKQLTVYYSGNLNNQLVMAGVRDTVIVINNSKHIKVNNLTIIGGNVFGIHVNSSDNVSILNCKVEHSNFAAIYATYVNGLIIRNNTIQNSMSNAIGTVLSKDIFIEKNYFYNIGNKFEYTGDNNSVHRMAVYVSRSTGNANIRYNYFKNIGYGAIVIHYYRLSDPTMNNGSDFPFNVEYNLVDGACLLGNDMGAIYCFNIRNKPATYRRFKNNIVMNVPGTLSMTKRATNVKMTMGIYFDERSSYIVADSNIVLRIAATAFFGNGNRFVSWKHNQAYDWHNQGTSVNGGGFYQNCFQLGNASNLTYKKNYLFQDFRNNTLNYKSFFSLRYRASDISTFSIDSNRYFSPFHTSTNNFKKGEYVWNGSTWGAKSSSVWEHVNFNNWKSTNSINETNSSLDFTIFDTVLVFKNWSPVARTFKFSADKAVDKDGKLLSGSIKVAPYYGEVVRMNGLKSSDNTLYIDEIFSTSPNPEPDPTPDPTPDPDPETGKPILDNKEFALADTVNNNYQVGLVSVSNPDAAMQYTYSITGGNTGNTFNLAASTGNLSVQNCDNLKTQSLFALQIAVACNHTPPKYDTAIYLVNVHKVVQEPELPVKVYYIDPMAPAGQERNGTIDRPFKSWAEVKWEPGAHYLQKSGTVANESKINVGADNVMLSAYGKGERPAINSSANDYGIRAFERSNVVISGLSVKAENAAACIYFIGSSSDNNTITNCVLESANNGIRIVDGYNFRIEYNTFVECANGIFSFAKTNVVVYNVFRKNDIAININSNLSKADIYNNVFYDNQVGVETSYSKLTIYNNIFYLESPNAQALNSNLDKILSDHNIFYPDRDGFLSINRTRYSSIDHYRKATGLDLNSFARDPQFVDIYNDNFQVLETSPAIDGGKYVGVYQDFYGSAVPNGNAPDIGLAEAAGPRVFTSSPSQDDHGLFTPLIYPNPSSGSFNVTLKSDTSIGEAAFKIITTTGQLVYEGVTLAEEKHFIDLTSQPKGCYMAVFRVGDEVKTEIITIM